MAGTVDLVQRGYCGIETRDGVLWLNPALPPEVKQREFGLRYRGCHLALRMTSDELTVTADASADGAVRIGHKAKIFVFSPGGLQHTAL